MFHVKQTKGQQMDFKNFTERMMILSAYFDKPLSEGVIALYYESLKKYSLEQFDLACKAILENHKWATMPKIAEFIEVIEGNVDDKAIQVWDLVLKSCDRFGAYRSVSFKNEAINRAITSIGGWIRLCEAPSDELKWIKREFINAYKSYHNKQLENTHLVGVSEANGNDENIYLVEISVKHATPLLLATCKTNDFKALENTAKTFKQLIFR